MLIDGMRNDNEPFLLFSGSANPDLAQSVASALGMSLSERRVETSSENCGVRHGRGDLVGSGLLLAAA